MKDKRNEEEGCKLALRVFLAVVQEKEKHNTWPSTTALGWISAVVCMRMAPITSYIGMFAFQLVNCLGRIRRCGLAGGAVL